MLIIDSFTYNLKEKEFVNYFERCKNLANMTYSEIENLLPQLQKYHDDMVKKDSLFRRRTLNELFDEWKAFDKGNIFYF